MPGNWLAQNDNALTVATRLTRRTEIAIVVKERFATCIECAEFWVGLSTTVSRSPGFLPVGALDDVCG